MNLGIEGRTALVTGGSQGIGHAIATGLVGEGARVALTSRSAEKAAAIAADIGAVGFEYDSADLKGTPRLVHAVEERLGPIEILICNTGGPPGGGPLDFTVDQWREAYDSLVLGPMALVHELVAGMRDRGWGRVVNVVSTSVREPIPNLMLSNAHRASMITAFKTVARAVAADGVTLNSVLPGLIATERVTRVFGSEAEAAEAFELPTRRLGTVEELAAAAVFLCSSQAGYINGETLAVDGAMTRSI